MLTYLRVVGECDRGQREGLQRMWRHILPILSRIEIRKVRVTVAEVDGDMACTEVKYSVVGMGYRYGCGHR